jgi:hypothetical protein
VKYVHYSVVQGHVPIGITAHQVLKRRKFASLNKFWCLS